MRPPSRPALRYFGGKWRLAPWVIGHFPRHRCYVEPMCGGASVLLRKARSDVEVVNDRADLVVTFFRVLRDRGDELVRSLELTPFARAEYEVADPTADGLTDLERARRFFVRSWGGQQGVAGNLRNRGWRRTPDRNVAREFAQAAAALDAVRLRLQGVAVESLDYREALRRYDRPDTLFYVDPPYLRSTRRRPYPSDGYGDLDMSEDEHVEMLELLRGLSGSVVLSGYPSALYDRALGGWTEHRHGRGPETLWVKGRQSGG